MKHIIYKYTNKINNKSYIGQTNNFDRRHKQHLQDSYHIHKGHEQSHDLPFHRAIRKYGIENFEITFLEEKDYSTYEEVNNDESYWINKLNSLVPNGYNLNAQGRANPGKNKTKIPSEKLNMIYDLLQNSSLNMTEISEKLDIPLSSLSDINKGRTARRDDYKYPLRRTKTVSYNEYLEIIDYIKNTNYSLSQIAKFFNRSIDLVQRVNKGHQSKVKKIYDGEFPIRENTNNGYTIKPIETIPSEIGSTPVIGTQVEKVC